MSSPGVGSEVPERVAVTSIFLPDKGASADLSDTTILSEARLWPSLKIVELVGAITATSVTAGGGLFPPLAPDPMPEDPPEL